MVGQPNLRLLYILIAGFLVGIIFLLSASPKPVPLPPRPTALSRQGPIHIQTYPTGTSALKNTDSAAATVRKPGAKKCGSKPSLPDSSQGVVETLPGLKHYTRIIDESRAKFLMLMLTRDEHSFRHVNEKERTIDDYVDVLQHSGLQMSNMSIAILTTTKSAYDHFIDALKKYDFAKVQVLYYAPIARPDAPKEPTDRHSDEYQPFRRQKLAMSRNLLMNRALKNEEHIFWHDADVVENENGILHRMLKHTLDPDAPAKAKNDEAGRRLPIGLITARARVGDNPDYDHNAWSHQPDSPARKTPTTEDLEDMKHGKIFVPDFTPNHLDMRRLTEASGDDDIFWLDSVGGLILYIKAELVRTGLVFPPYYVIGTSWDRPNGWDAIETEGLCYIANTMGWGCYGLGGKWHIEHTPDYR